MNLTAKYGSTCPVCGQAIHVGDTVEWSRGRAAMHVACQRAGNAGAVLDAIRAPAFARYDPAPVPSPEHTAAQREQRRAAIAARHAAMTPEQLAGERRANERASLTSHAQEAEQSAILAWYDAQPDARLAIARLAGPGVDGILLVARREVAS